MSRADELEQSLAATDLFRGLKPKTLHKIRDAGEVQQFSAGEVITAEGAPVSGWKVFSHEGVYFHLILDGTAEVQRGGTTVATLGPGAYFGELSLLDGKPRSADVVAAEGGLTTFALPEFAFTSLLQEYPEIALPIVKVLAARLRATSS